MQYIIKADNLTKDYKNGKGVFNVSFGVQQGEAMGFLGPNGAGKTTTIRQLMGFIKPDFGNAYINNMHCFNKAKYIQSNVGYLPGEIAFFDDMTGKSLINYVSGMRKMKDMTRAKKLAEYFELDINGKIKKMSKGTRQKLGIVCAFMHDPAVYLLDEPTSGLDPLMQNKFTQLVKSEKQRGKTILMSSHLFDEVERTCDFTAIINRGKIVGTESLKELKLKRQKKYTIVFENENEASDFAKTNGGAKLKGNVEAEVKINGKADSLIKAIAKYKIEDINVQTGTLEEVFLQFYSSERQGK